MEEQNSKNGLQFSTLEINWIANNASGLLGNLDSNPHHIMTPGSNGIHLEPIPVPPWMYCQPVPLSYVDFLAESGYPEIQKNVSYGISTRVPSLGLAVPSQLEEYLTPHKEGDAITAFTGLEHQFGVQKQSWSGECSHVSKTDSGPGSEASKYSSEARRKRSREKAYAADRCRRLRISHWLDALQELVPHSKAVRKEAMLDDVIEHIKYLQYQVKNLCRSRLAGGSTSDTSESVIYLEGHGHYFVQDQMLNGPLEEMMGKLIDVCPSAATEMLQSRGLLVMPMTSEEGLLEAMLDVQEKGASLISK